MKGGDELGNYVVDAEIGRGNFGIVYRAHNKRYGEMQRAIKVLRASGEDVPELARLFEREAAILQKIDSPHVCRIFDFGHASDGRPYIAMELLVGETLAEVVKRGPLPVEVALDYAAQICAGLTEVHRHGIVHRDVKPANVFVTRRADGVPVLKLLDFNISKRPPPEVGTTLSGVDTGPGTDHYMSPEQITEPATVDAATDLWAVGAVLFELATGFPPFRGANPSAIKVAIVTGDRHELPASAADVAPILARCLVERRARFSSADELAAEIRNTLARPHSPQVDLPAPHGTPAPLSVRALDAIAKHWLMISLGLLTMGLTLLLGSFAVHPELNEFVHGTKRIGYISSFNWSIVHTFLCPIELALVARLLARATAVIARFGPRAVDEWRRRHRRIVLQWLVLTLLFAVGYTLVEWRPLLVGDCDGGTFLGWPNRLCAVTGSTAIHAFMVVAMIAQVAVVSVAWLLFSIVVWLCDLIFGRTAILRVRSGDGAALIELFRTALWAWVTLFVAVFLARLWSFHLQTPGTDGIVETLVWGIPGTLFDLNIHTQPDMSSMIAGTVMLVSALAPFALLRLRLDVALPHTHRPAIALGLVAVIATAFPRFGVFCLLALALVLLAISLAHRAARGWSDRP